MNLISRIFLDANPRHTDIPPGDMATHVQDVNRQRTILVLILLGIMAALVLPLSSDLAGLQDGDGAVSALISTQKLTWYFWGQDRFLDLLPALAWPFRDPVINLHVQVALRAVCAFMSPLAVVVLFRCSWRTMPMVVLLTGAAMAVALTPYGSFNMWAEHNPCGTAMLLFAISAWLCQSRSKLKWVLSFALLFLAYAVNIALATWSLPFLAVALGFGIRDRRWLVKVTGLNLLATAAASLHGRWVGETATSFSARVSMDAMANGYRSLAAELNMPLMAMLLGVAIAASFARRSRESTMAIVVAGGMIIGIAALSCLEWLQTNAFHVRYYLTFITCFVSCCVYAVINALPEPWLARRVQLVGGSAVALIMFFFGLGGLSNDPSALIDARWRPLVTEASKVAVDNHASLIMGNYHDVWPSVLLARSELRQASGVNAPMYGISFRSHVLRKRIASLFASSPEGVMALCLEPSLAECTDAMSFAHIGRPFTADESRSRKLTIAGKPAYLVAIRPEL